MVVGAQGEIVVATIFSINSVSLESMMIIASSQSHMWGSAVFLFVHVQPNIRPDFHEANKNELGHGASTLLAYILY